MAIGKKRPTQRSISAKETKNKIFKTALKLFSKYGYDKVTVEDITNHAKISKGNFYTHFDSKDSVLTEQFNRIDSYYIEKFNQFATLDMSGGARLRLLITAMCDYCKNVCGINAIQVVYANQVASNKHVEILNNHSRPFYKYIHDSIVYGQQHHEFRADITPDELTKLVARLCRALLFDWCLYNDAFDLQVEGERYTDFILDAIKK